MEKSVDSIFPEMVALITCFMFVFPYIPEYQLHENKRFVFSLLYP